MGIGEGEGRGGILRRHACRSKRSAAASSVHVSVRDNYVLSIGALLVFAQAATMEELSPLDSARPGRWGSRIVDIAVRSAGGADAHPAPGSAAARDLNAPTMTYSVHAEHIMD